MTRQKDLKRRVRARMTKTGEAYTTARSQVLKKSVTKRTPAPARTAAVSATPPVDYAALAGMSDEKIREKTGCIWERWVHALDRRGAERMPHRKIAALISEKYGVDGWWAQTVTVGYERIKGLRARGQRLDGTFEAGKSRTYNVPVVKLFAAWKEPALRRRWLSEDVKVRTATAPKSMRLGWEDGSIVAVWFMPKGAARSNVALAHTRLRDRETAERLKQFWGERLDALAEVLGDKN